MWRCLSAYQTSRLLLVPLRAAFSLPVFVAWHGLQSPWPLPWSSGAPPLETGMMWSASRLFAVPHARHTGSRFSMARLHRARSTAEAERFRLLGVSQGM